jgi:tetratricopeptide (TPR) repeat protein
MNIYQKVLQHYPDDWLAANNLAFLISETGNSKASLQRALELALRAEKANPGSPFVQDTLGWIYYKLGNPNKAEKEISKAVKKMTKSGMIRYHLAVVEHDLGKNNNAKENFKRAISGSNDFMGKEKAEILYKKYYGK